MRNYISKCSEVQLEINFFISKMKVYLEKFFLLNIHEVTSSRFELVKQSWIAKNSERSEGIGPAQEKKFLNLSVILWEMQRVLTKFCELIWTILYYESLWNHVVFHQELFNRLKVTYYIASSMNNSENSWSIWFKRFANFRKNAKTHSQTAKTLCKLRIANG